MTKGPLDYLLDYKDAAHAVRGSIAKASFAIAVVEAKGVTDRTKQITKLLDQATDLAQEL